MYIHVQSRGFESRLSGPHAYTHMMILSWQTSSRTINSYSTVGGCLKNKISLPQQPPPRSNTPHTV